MSTLNPAWLATLYTELKDHVNEIKEWEKKETDADLVRTYPEFLDEHYGPTKEMIFKLRLLKSYDKDKAGELIKTDALLDDIKRGLDERVRAYTEKEKDENQG
jgi:hypothetical protein